MHCFCAEINFNIFGQYPKSVITILHGLSLCRIVRTYSTVFEIGCVTLIPISNVKQISPRMSLSLCPRFYSV